MRRIVLIVVAGWGAGCGFQAATGSPDVPATDAAPVDVAVTVDAPSADAPTSDPPGPCQSTMIMASKSYSPSVWNNGALPVTSPYLLLTLPPTLAVTMGNAGNHCAELAFKRDDGQLVRCRYRGGASSSSPTIGIDAVQVQNGLRYQFDQCTAGAACPTVNGSVFDFQAGDELGLSTDSTPITLRIDHGDINAGTTVVEQSLSRCEDVR